MNTFSNTNTSNNIVEEINNIVNELLNITKKFIYKHHNIIGYF